LDVSNNLARALDGVPNDEALEREESLTAGMHVFNLEMIEALCECPDPTKEAGAIGQVMKV